MTSFSGMTEEQTDSETARTESEMWQNAFCLDVQDRAGVVGVMAFADITPF